ncbi:hypothetical protein, partial [Campylobacter armoricus]|uniref:hypothetical protein n=1 Tax=Campylobacter armoricus TaxID=2505970 RepID=UPI001117699C
MDEFLSESFPADEIKAVVENKRNQKVIDQLKKILNINELTVKESFYPAIINGKQQIDALRKEVESLKENNSKLLTSKTIN